MNKVVTINLNGTAYQLEDQGYDALLTYLSDAANKLSGNPDKDEIIADIEQAIGDKCRATLTSFKSVVLTQEVQEIIAQMGSVDDGSEAAEKPAAGAAASAAPRPEPAAAAPRPKRLYRLREGSMVAGVCAGLAAYFEVDPTLIRLAFALVTILTYGTGLLAYLVMVIVVPYATSEADKADAFGEPLTAKEFIRRAKAGYYEGMKSFGDRKSRREWQHRFKRDMRDWSRSFKRDAKVHQDRWSHQWHEHWNWNRSRPSLAAAIILPIVGLFSALITIATIFILISLITTGAIFGTLLPAALPAWEAVILLIIAYQVALLPLRIAKGIFIYGHWVGRRGAHVVIGSFHTSVWICLVAFGVWYANRHVPEVHRYVLQGEPAVHAAIHSFKEWWARQ